jgi:hypothetical protein
MYSDLYSEIKIKQNSIDTLKYIAKDIYHPKNPIKYHNKYFCNNWNKHTDNINNLFNTTSKLLLNIINNTSEEFIDKQKINTKKWNNIYHEYPINYEYYINEKKNIPYDKFWIDYHRRDINIKNIKFLQYILKYNDLNITSDSDILDKLNYFQNGFFIDLDIKSYVENHIDSYDKYNFPHMNLTFFYSSNIDLKYKSRIIAHFYIISKWIYLLLGNSLQREKINFVYFDTPLVKKIDKTFDFLSSHNVNSGLSSSGKILMIWRNEESLKVFIHEMIHYLDKDVKYDYDFNSIINYNLGSIDFPILINETITELQAQIFHTIYISVFIDLSNKTTSDKTTSDKTTSDKLNILTFNTLYNYEQMFSWYQFAKIMDFYSIDKFEKKHLINKFNQSSSVFSYYILKSILGIKFGDIIFELDHINYIINGKFNPLQNNPTELLNRSINVVVDDNTHSHNEVIQCNVYECKKLVKYIKKIINKPPIKLLNKVIKHLNLNDESLRMTITELNI